MVLTVFAAMQSIDPICCVPPAAQALAGLYPLEGRPACEYRMAARRRLAMLGRKLPVRSSGAADARLCAVARMRDLGDEKSLP
jgi:hypothetical protein